MQKSSWTDTTVAETEKHPRGALLYGSLLVVGTIGYQWWSFYRYSFESRGMGLLVVTGVTGLMFLVAGAGIVRLAVRGLAWRLLMLGIVWLLVNVVFGFAETYYFVDSIYGGFSERLSHVDALYLTVGILSTAGSSIGVNSPLARSIVIVQMVTDLVLIGGVGAVVVSRFRGER